MTVKSKKLGIIGCGSISQAYVDTTRPFPKVVAGTAFMICPGYESRRPNPDFYYARGGGPVFDMAPCYLTALVTLLGPVQQVGA